MEHTSLTTATWLWLLGPMIIVLILCVVTLFTGRSEKQ